MGKSLKDYASEPRKLNGVHVKLRARDFARVYLEKRNVTEAAIACGYSPKTAFSSGSRFLRHPYVQQAINDLQRPAYTEDSLRHTLADVLADPGTKANLIRAVELAMREKAMLTEKVINENVNKANTIHLDSKSQETLAQLEVTASGIQPKSEQIDGLDLSKDSPESIQDAPGQDIVDPPDSIHDIESNESQSGPIKQ